MCCTSKDLDSLVGSRLGLAMADKETHVGSFGSFHSSDLAKLLLAPEDSYQPPPLPPVSFPTFTEKAEFGADMKEKHFFLDKDWTFINHGAFGAALKEALQAQMAWQMYVESQPVRFIDRELFPFLIYAITRVAKFLGAAKTDLVFVQNATTGNNAVIRSVVKTLKPGDSILTTSVTYGTVKKLLKEVSQEREIRIDEVQLTFPLKSADEIVQLVRAAIKPDTKFAVFDHVSSAQGLVLPVKELVAVCHENGVQVLVDAAHCFGSMPIRLRDIGADYYVMNAHKWFCSPKGVAILYVDPKHHDIIRPLLVSWGHGYGFHGEFAWTGLMDYCSYLSMHTVLDFWEFYGPDNIREYIYKTAKEAGDLLTRSWGTELLADSSLFRMMVVVGLPEGVVPAADRPPVPEGGGALQYSYQHAVIVQNMLHHEFKIEVPVKVIGGKLYVRVAAHVYNTLSDYQRLAEAINEIKLRNSS